jgi:hypothetical protein
LTIEDAHAAYTRCCAAGEQPAPADILLLARFTAQHPDLLTTALDAINKWDHAALAARLEGYTPPAWTETAPDGATDAIAILAVHHYHMTGEGGADA